MKKEGEVWISAVIYIGLGVVAITLLIGAGIPLINKMRDKNTYYQTKEVMHTIDDAILTVVSEGPGSRRFLSPLTLKKGKLFIDENQDGQVRWTMETKSVLQEPGVNLAEGNLVLNFTEDDIIVGQYDATIFVFYQPKGIELSVNDDVQNGQVIGLDGTFSLSITNNGVDPAIGQTIVDIQVE